MRKGTFLCSDLDILVIFAHAAMIGFIAVLNASIVEGIIGC